MKELSSQPTPSPRRPETTNDIYEDDDDDDLPRTPVDKETSRYFPPVTSLAVRNTYPIPFHVPHLTRFKFRFTNPVDNASILESLLNFLRDCPLLEDLEISSRGFPQYRRSRHLPSKPLHLHTDHALRSRIVPPWSIRHTLPPTFLRGVVEELDCNYHEKRGHQHTPSPSGPNVLSRSKVDITQRDTDSVQRVQLPTPLNTTNHSSYTHRTQHHPTQPHQATSLVGKPPCASHSIHHHTCGPDETALSRVDHAIRSLSGIWQDDYLSVYTMTKVATQPPTASNSQESVRRIWNPATQRRVQQLPSPPHEGTRPAVKMSATRLLPPRSWPPSPIRASIRLATPPSRRRHLHHPHSRHCHTPLGPAAKQVALLAGSAEFCGWRYSTTCGEGGVSGSSEWP